MGSQPDEFDEAWPEDYVCDGDSDEEEGDFAQHLVSSAQQKNPEKAAG